MSLVNLNIMYAIPQDIYRLKREYSKNMGSMFRGIMFKAQKSAIAGLKTAARRSRWSSAGLLCSIFSLREPRGSSVAR